MTSRAITAKEKRVIVMRLLALWESRPSERLGQFIVNAIGGGNVPEGCTVEERLANVERVIYGIEDFDLIDKMAKRIEGGE